MKQNLTHKELLAVYDITASLIDILSPKEQAIILAYVGIPIKCLVSNMSMVFIKGFVSVIRGGKVENEVNKNKNE